MQQILMQSSEEVRRSPEQEQERPKPHKVFVTNLQVEVAIPQLEAQLWEKFARFGNLDSVVVKKSFNNEYCYAFIEYKEGEDASEAVKLNGTVIAGKKMKVELQDNARRRKGGSETCFNCGKPGHYARDCRQKKPERGKFSFTQSEVDILKFRYAKKNTERGRSRSESRKKSKKRRERSSSSVSRSPKKKKCM